MLVTGDAGGAINPFNGEGIAYAYETGRLAAEVLERALATGDGLALQRYEQRAQDDLRPLLQGGPGVREDHRQPRAHAGPGLHRHARRTLMEWVLRIMANLLRPDELGPAEAAYKAVALIARVDARAVVRRRRDRDRPALTSRPLVTPDNDDVGMANVDDEWIPVRFIGGAPVAPGRWLRSLLVLRLLAADRP